MRPEAGGLIRAAMVGLLTLVTAQGTLVRSAFAQPMMGGAPGGGRGMPNLRLMNGRPLPDGGLAAGTVTVRVARKMPVNAVAGAEVSAIITNAGGDLKKRTATTDASGRAIFEGVGAGNQFQAEVKVDGETIKTSSFTMPPTGGVRTMLIAGLGAAPAGGGDGAEAQDRDGDGAGEASGAARGGGEAFTLGASTGTTTPAGDLPTKTLEVRAVDEAGRPLPNLPVQLGAASQGNEGKLKISRATTNASGVARFDDLPNGATVGYAAVVDYHGVRLGTQPFTMPDSGGVRAEIHALERTADPSIITLGAGGRIILQMHDEVLQVLEMVPVENRSSKLFDPGPGGVEIPLPKGFVNAEAGEAGEHKLEVRPNYGIAVHGPIAPRNTTNNEVTFGFTVPYRGATHEFKQLMPNGLGTTTLIIEQVGNLAVEGPGIGARQSREVNGRKYWVMPIEAVSPGQKLSFLVTGLPSTDNTGRIAAGALALLLVLASVVFGRRPVGGERKAAALADRDRLLARRETLFEQLLVAERERRAQGVTATDASAKERRNQIVAKLEGVYRDLAALDEPRAP
jgi:hypothetical protein